MVVYIATIHKEDDSDYGIQFYDFPGCITAGSTLEEARQMADEALNGHISFLVADGDEIPAPSSLEKILVDPDHRDAIAFIIVEVTNELIQRVPEFGRARMMKNHKDTKTQSFLW